MSLECAFIFVGRLNILSVCCFSISLSLFWHIAYLFVNNIFSTSVAISIMSTRVTLNTDNTLNPISVLVSNYVQQTERYDSKILIFFKVTHVSRLFLLINVGICYIWWKITVLHLCMYTIFWIIGCGQRFVISVFWMVRGNTRFLFNSLYKRPRSDLITARFWAL